MRYRFLLLFLIPGMAALAQPPGIDDSILAIKGKWQAKKPFVGDYDPALKPAQFPLIYQRTNTISSLILQTFPEVRGSDPSWYAAILGKPYFQGGPSPYQYSCLFKYYYYNTAYKKLMPHAEPGTGATAYVNGFRFLIEPTGLIAVINDRQKEIYEVCNTSGEWKGYPVYRVNDNSYKNYQMILLTKNGQLPWKAVSQIQYLQAYRSMRLQETKKITDQIDKGIAQGKKDLEKMRADKRFTENVIAAGQKAYDMQVAKRDANIKLATDLLEKDLKAVDDYINSASPETLRQQAVIPLLYGHKVWRGFADPSDKKAQKIVYIDQSYFDKNLPTYEPQFITLTWYWMNATGSLFFKEEFEKKFPVDKLQAMIRGDRKPDANRTSPKQQLTREIETMLQSVAGKNDEPTWTDIKSRISHFLIQKWKEGGLKGASSAQAFYVKADRTTMTQNDIDNGKLIVEVGVAFISPAEFEIFRFEKKL